MLQRVGERIVTVGWARGANMATTESVCDVVIDVLIIGQFG